MLLEIKLLHLTYNLKTKSVNSKMIGNYLDLYQISKILTVIYLLYFIIKF